MSIEVVYYVASSLDGYIATPDGGVEWLGTFQNSGDDHSCADFYRSVDGVVMGSRTYEVALRLVPWPAYDEPSWVMTSRRLPTAHRSVTCTASPRTGAWNT